MGKKKPIGVFDSGIGGLTVLKALQRLLPHENFVYFADTAHLPYGEKTPDQIMTYTRQILTWMQNDIGVKLVVAACNTSSSVALETLSAEFSIPIIGTIHPMVETVLLRHQASRIGIIATPTSVDSRMHERVLRQSGFEGVLCSIPCPRFVPIIESGRIFGPELRRAAYEYLDIFQKENLDTLIYGCTHYPWAADTIQQVLPETVCFVDPAEPIAAKVSQELYKNKAIHISLQKGAVDFYCSQAPERFSTQVSLLLSIPQPNVTFIDLGGHGILSEKMVVNQ